MVSFPVEEKREKPLLKGCLNRQNKTVLPPPEGSVMGMKLFWVGIIGNQSGWVGERPKEGSFRFSLLCGERERENRSKSSIFHQKGSKTDIMFKKVNFCSIIISKEGWFCT